MDSSITAADIIDHIKLVEEKLRDPVIREKLLAYEKEQLKNEEILVSNNQICSKNELTEIRERISNLKPNDLKKDVTERFYDPAVMEAAMCTIDSVIYAPPDDIGTQYHNNLINEYITGLKQIGTESKNGYAMLGNFDGIKDFFVDKVSRDPNNDNLVHELVVGLYGTNKLRQYIPNFSYIYGGLKCSPPLIDPNTKKVVYSCLNNNNLVNYVLYENVAPAIDMSKYVRTCTRSQFLNVFMQTLYSLRLAAKLIDYTHYDLHAENLLVREPKIDKGKIFQIPYETENGVEYLRTNVIATFIDYGYSHMKTEDIIDEKNGIIFKGQHFGSHGREHASIFSNRSFIIYDAYRLLMNCINDAYNNQNNAVINEISKIFKFFNKTDDALQFALDGVPGILPLIDKTENLQLDDLIKYIRSVCNCDFINSSPTSDPILDCESLCVSEQKILEDVGLTGNIKIPNNILQFYDLTVVLKDQKTQLDFLIDNFPYNETIDDFLDELYKLADELIDKIFTFNNSDYPDVSNLFNINTMNKVRQIYINMGEILNLRDKVINYMNIGDYVANLYGDDAAVNDIKNLNTDVNDNYLLFRSRVLTILEKYGIYLDGISDDDYRDIVNNDEKLNWYWSDRQNLQDTFLDLMGVP